jgi:hypothetical protein
MDKRAQNRSMYGNLVERLSPLRQITETFSPKYKAHMQALRDVDNNVRKTGVEINKLAKQAKSLLNSHHLLKGAGIASLILDHFDNVVVEFKKLRSLEKDDQIIERASTGIGRMNTYEIRTQKIAAIAIEIEKQMGGPTPYRGAGATNTYPRQGGRSAPTYPRQGGTPYRGSGRQCRTYYRQS